MIFNQETALRWLIETARYARQQRLDAGRWLLALDPQWYALALAYVTERQVHAIAALVWSSRPML